MWSRRTQAACATPCLAPCRSSRPKTKCMSGSLILFGSVATGHDGRVEQIQVKQENSASEWIWGAFKLTGAHFAALHRLWLEREGSDEYFGTLVNAYLANGGLAYGIKRGDVYVDVGTLQGYREAVRVL